MMVLSDKVNVLKDQFLSELTLNPSSILQYEKVLNIFILWQTKKDVNVTQPTRATYAKFFNELKAKDLSSRTIDNYTAIIRKFFKWMVDLSYYDIDITDRITPLRKSNDYVKAPLPEDKAMILLNHKPGNSVIEVRNHAIINTMIRIGLRRIEISRLNVCDIFQVGTQWFIRVHGKGRYQQYDELPITQDILTPIQNYWKYRMNPEESDPAFINHARCSSGRITPHFISVMAKARLRSIGLDNKLFSSHSFRHTAAYFAFKSGSKQIEVQQMLRQRDGRSTEQYLKAFNHEKVKDGTAIFNLDSYYKKLHRTNKKRNENHI